MESGEVWDEICHIQKEQSPDLRDFFDGCYRLCKANTSWRSYIDSDLNVYSSNYHIHGIIDKIFSDAPFFSIVRSSTAPSSGIYTSDRVRIAAYTACLQELLGDHIEGGCVEYIPSGIIRYCHVEPLDKRRFLKALHETRRIASGEIPRRPLRPPCENCPEAGHCRPDNGIRLSDLL